MAPADHVSPNISAAAAAPMDGPQDFAALFARSFPSLWLVAFGGVGNRALAEDVLQEAAIVALGKFDQYQPGTNFTAWMSRIVHFVARNQGRRERRRSFAPLDSAAQAAAPGKRRGSEEHDVTQFSVGALPVDQQLFDDQMIRALRQVDQTPRTCLLLRTLQGLEYSEISMMLGIPEGTAMSHVHRTRRFLREQLAHLDPALRPEGGPPPS